MKSIKDIVRDAGGPAVIAGESAHASRRISEKGVYSWFRIGIPDQHWPLIMRLSGATERELLAANESIRRSEKGRAA